MSENNQFCILISGDESLSPETDAKPKIRSLSDMSLMNTLFGIETESETKVREHNEGEIGGSQADWADRFAHRVGGGGSEHYNLGWVNGENNQPQSDDDDDD